MVKIKIIPEKRYPSLDIKMKEYVNNGNITLCKFENSEDLFLVGFSNNTKSKLDNDGDITECEKSGIISQIVFFKNIPVKNGVIHSNLKVIEEDFLTIPPKLRRQLSIDIRKTKVKFKNDIIKKLGLV